MNCTPFGINSEYERIKIDEMNVVLMWAPTVLLLTVLGMVFQSYRDEKVAWALDFKNFSVKLKGYWTPLFLLVAPLAFVYNVVATAAYAVMVLFEWAVRLVRWMVGVVLWLWNKGFMWYWRNVIVTPVVLLWKILWHYVIVWPWRIYKAGYHEVKGSFGRAGMRIGWLSMTLVSAIVGIGYWGATWADQDLLLFLCVLLAEVPFLWGLGVLASMREHEDGEGKKMEAHRAVGMRTAQLGMKYVSAAAAVLVLVYLIAYSGAIPTAGYLILGVLITGAHAATAVGIGVALVLVLSLVVLPSYVLDGREESPLDEMLSLIKMGRDSFLKVLVGLVPGSVLGALVALLPVVVVLGAFYGTYELKNAALDNMAGVVADKAATIDETLANSEADFAAWSGAIQDQPSVQKRGAQIDYLTAFPLNLLESPEAAMSGIQTVDYSSMHEEMRAAYEARQSMRSERTAELQEEAALLRADIALERDERSTYKVERSSDAGETWSVVADGMVQSGYVDNGLASGESYQYRVTASNRKGDSGPGNVTFAVTRSADIIGPASVRAKAEGNFRVVLNWNDRDWNEEGFVVERSYGGDSWSEMVRLPANTTSYVDEAVRDTTYVYRVRAYRGEQETEPVSTWRGVQPSLAAPRSRVAETNASSALVVWSHDGDYRTVSRGGESVDGDGAALSYSGMSRLDELESLLAQADEALLRLEEDAAADAASTGPRLDLLQSLPVETEASRPLRIATFLLGMLALALLAGAALSTLMAYLARLIQTLVRLTDGGDYYFASEIRAVRKENDNQPLLGFLLLGLTGPVVIPFLVSSALSVLVALGGVLMPMNVWGSSEIEIEEMFELNLSDFWPDLSVEIDLDTSGGDETAVDNEEMGGGEVESEEANTYIMKNSDQTVWGELTAVFGAENYEAIRKANSDVSEDDWRAMGAGAEVQLPLHLN